MRHWRVVTVVLLRVLLFLSLQPAVSRAQSLPENPLAVYPLAQEWLASGADTIAVSAPLLVPDTARPPRHRSPWKAAGLAYLFPGAGHFYAGEPRRAWTVIGLVGLGVNVALSDAGSGDTATAGFLLALGTYALSVVDAPRAARRQNRRAAAAPR